jgi:hypothetical protein
MQELQGKHIQSVHIGVNEASIKFMCDNEEIVFIVDGDCCSESWFSEILNLDAIVGHTVFEVQELKLPTHYDCNGRQEIDCFYGYGITTDVGHATIVFRNSSNGYYGGSINLAEPAEVVAIKDWTNISYLQDWTAYDLNDQKEGNPPSYYRILKCQVLQ